MGAVFSPDGLVTASCGHDRMIVLYSSTTKTATLAGHTGYVTCIAFTSDSKILLSGSQDKTVRAWGSGDGSLLKTVEIKAQVSSVAVSSKGEHFAVGTDGGQLKHPVQMNNVRHGVGERFEIVMDFSAFAGQTLYLVNAPS